MCVFFCCCKSRRQTNSFVNFVQRHTSNTRRYYFNAPQPDTRVLQNGSDTTWTTINLSNFVPATSTNVILNVQFSSGISGSAADSLFVKPTDVTNALLRIRQGVVSSAKMTLVQEIATDSAQEVDYKVSDNNNDATIVVRGFDDEL